MTTLTMDAVPQVSTYFRVAPTLLADDELAVPDVAARVRRMLGHEVDRMIERRHKKVLPARLMRERDFYTQRLRQLAGATIIQVQAPGDPDAARAHGNSVADVVEAAAIVACSLDRGHDGVARDLRTESSIDIVVATGWKMRSSSRRVRGPGALRITPAVVRRFSRAGMQSVVGAALGTSKMAPRIDGALRWVREAVIEAHRPAAVVKLVTALEVLLVNGREQPTRAIAERGAFILSEDPEQRARASRALHRLYDLRGNIVHRGTTSASARTLDLGLQLFVDLLATVASNSKEFPTMDALVQWTEAQRWAASTHTLARPKGQNGMRAVRALLRG